MNQNSSRIFELFRSVKPFIFRPNMRNTSKAGKSEEPSRSGLHLSTVLDAMADDTRLNILRQLAFSGEKACGTFGIEVPKSTLSHHFRVLRLAGVVSVRREGKELINSIRREDLEARFPGLLDSVVSPSV